MLCQFKMLLNVDKWLRLKAAKLSFLFNISQKWSQLVGQTEITEALLITDSNESNFSTGGEKEGLRDFKKMRDSEEGRAEETRKKIKG